ncbi:hypothetical protein L226DRAFT_98802 [Lentinus tigrinus ALCF2SS1-7]|uniref:Uncharacterized protein n=1 Tax=Lentinus tigrinus ALCF2SS1-6 TaxID=1328759 RepID=A0A5C2RU50_9APHY|nr:hypothetical protein L227DRAFT_369542 [Lentinus tigrinus ALCF2SS1-6]RPD73829.1 hypothetical protein L226DRAFT_98802 [Lentinus tigrinus ALCF2SS1-7]
MGTARRERGGRGGRGWAWAGGDIYGLKEAKRGRVNSSSQTPISHLPSPSALLRPPPGPPAARLPDSAVGRPDVEPAAVRPIPNKAPIPAIRRNKNESISLRSHIIAPTTLSPFDVEYIFEPLGMGTRCNHASLRRNYRFHSSNACWRSDSGGGSVAVEWSRSRSGVSPIKLRCTPE